MTMNIQDQIDSILSSMSDEKFRDRARAALERQYPAASPEMIGKAFFHIYIEGLPAVLDWLNNIARFAENTAELNTGSTYHLLYHLYNWQQFCELMPKDITAVTNDLKELKTLLESRMPMLHHKNWS